MEFIPGPFQILGRIRNAPDRWSRRLTPILSRIRPSSAKNVKGVPFSKAIGPLATAGLTYADIQGGEEPWKAAGRNISGLVGGTVVAPIAEAIPIPGTSVPGYIAGDHLGRTLFDKAIDDRGLSGLLQGKGWNNPFAPSPEVSSSTESTTTTAPVIDLTTNQQANETAKGLEKYGFNENFALTPKDDGTYGVVRSEAGKKADAFLNAKEQWLQDTANSPAAKAGVFSPEERWQTHLNNQRWRREKGRSFKHGDFLD